MTDQISTDPLSKEFTLVHGRRMAHHEQGSGPPVVFLHGNPTSSYLWRNVIPHVADRARCIAVDLIGQGDSDKLDDPGPGSYRFVEHRRYLDGLLDELDLGDEVTFVVHDWGSALGFDWAFRHPDRVAGIAYMEAIVAPVTWDDWPEAARGVFQGFRSPGGEEMILDRNLFVELILPSSVIRTMREEEMDEYRRPFAEPGESRRPTLTWPRELPIEEEPEDVCTIVADYGRWLAECDVPKLFFNAEPGAILTGTAREFCRTWPNQQEVQIEGIHYVQEDSPHEIGRAVATWLPTA